MHKRIFNIKRKQNILKQRMQTASHFVYQGGIFAADRELLSYVSSLDSPCCVQDLNEAPIWIEDISEFRQKVRSKHQEVMNELYEQYQKVDQ